MENKKQPGISFWKKESGNLMSHGSGLTAEQVEFLKELKVGDRLIVWANSPKDEKQPTHAFKKYIKKEEF